MSFSRRVLACLLVAAALAGCGDPSGMTPEPPKPAGDRAAPGRIVTLAPNLTEIAFALGLGPRVVGVSDYVTWPPEALDRPSLGGLFDPNLEAVVGLEPDLAIVLPSQAEVADRLERSGIETLRVTIESLDDLERGVVAVAERCAVPEAGAELAAELRRRLAPRPIPGAPRILLSVDRAPGRTENLLVAGPGTFLHEMLTRLGAENAFADSPVRYPQVGMEEVLAREPEGIVEIRATTVAPEMVERLLADWRRYPGLPAVDGDALAVVGEDYALIPGPRLPLLYDRLEEVVRRAAERSTAEEDRR